MARTEPPPSPCGGAPLTTRRTLLAAAAASTAAASVARATGPYVETFLETRLFNFRDDLSLEATAEAARRLRGFATAGEANGLILGRNLNSTPFPTRFEWFYMAGRRASAMEAGASAVAAAALAALLSPVCASVVGCDLSMSLPDGFAAGAGVKIRHTVMFDFKREASAEARRRIIEAIRAMGRLGMVQSYVVEENPAFGSDPSQMEWQVIGDFASLTDYKAYSDDPAHLAMRDDFKAATSRVAFIDVEV